MRIRELSLKGYCCSQIMVQLGLDYVGKENPDMIQAAAGLCKGIRSGKICGVLTGAAMMLTIIDSGNAAEYMIPELSEWFEETYTERFGGPDCNCIIGESPIQKGMRCTKIMEETYEKAMEILMNTESNYKGVSVPSAPSIRYGGSSLYE